MKLSELKQGDRFVLVRTGASYTLGEKYLWCGRPSSRFIVTPDSPHWMDNSKSVRPSLNHQCEVVKI